MSKIQDSGTVESCGDTDLSEAAQAAQSVTPGAVLCVARPALETILAGRRGFVELPFEQLRTLLDPVGPNGWVAREKGPGGLEDPEGMGRRWVQVIPYALFEHPGTGDWWTYRRRGGGEGRLEGLLSLGVGGHVETCDHMYQPENPFLSMYAGLGREMAEEVCWAPKPVRTQGPHYRGVVFLDGPDDAPVNHVHLGVVFVVRTPQVIPHDDQGIEAVGWTGAGALLVARADFEAWSRVLIEQWIAANGGA